MNRGQASVMTIRTVPITGKTVLLRVDYDIPLTDNGVLTSDEKVRESLPTIERLLRDHCKIVMISETGGGSHLRDSLEPAAARLAQLLGRPVRFVSDCVGERARMAVKRAPSASVIVLENLRRHPELLDSTSFAEQLVHASGARIFVQDDRSVVAGTSLASVTLPQYLPAVAGLLLEQAFDANMDGIIEPGIESLLRWYPL